MNPYCLCPYKDREIEDQHCVACGLEVDPEYFDHMNEIAQEAMAEIEIEEENN